MWLRLLGALEIRDGTAWRSIPSAKQRAVLAALVLHRGRSVDRDWLLETVWSGGPPASARRLLSHYIWRLRCLLPDGDATLRTVPGGYQLVTASDGIDVDRFAALADAGRRASESGDHGPASERLAAALALWRGPALADTRATDWLEMAARELDLRRVQTTELLGDAHLAGGRNSDAVTLLAELAHLEPFRERPWAMLMRALDGMGRRVEALAAYRRMRQLWKDELGIEPGRELSDLHRRLLEGSAVDPPGDGRRGHRARPARARPGAGAGAGTA